MIYFLGGPPRTGKSIIANAVTREHGINAISTDSLGAELETVLDPETEPGLFAMIDSRPSEAVMMIRPMDRKDESAVSDLLCDCYRWLSTGEAYTRDQVDFLVAERGSLTTVRRESHQQQYMVACRSEVIVGMVAVADGQITKLYVAPGHHGEGIGTALFEAAEAYVRAAGFGRITLGTTPNTVEYYEARGMSVEGRKIHTKGVFRGRETVLMAKKI